MSSFLKKPANDHETFAEIVVQEWNCRFCPKNLQYHDDQKKLTTHLWWLYNALRTAAKDDLVILSSEYFVINSTDDPYYQGGFIQALEDAMERGAKVFILIERLWIGGRNAQGECLRCSGKGEPFACYPESTVNIGMPYYCEGMNGVLKRLSSHQNFLVYDVPYSLEMYQWIHSHFKWFAVYFKSLNLVARYFGSWNFNTSPQGNKVEEIGVGLTTTMSSEVGQYCVWFDIQFITVIENYYYDTYLKKTNKQKISDLLKTFLHETPPKQPLKVARMVTFGPNYCDPNFGKGAVGPLENESPKETQVIAIDHDVTLSLGITPKPQDDPMQQDWKTKGYPASMKFAQVVDIIQNAEESVEVLIHSELLEESPNDIYSPVEKALLETPASIFVVQNDQSNWGTGGWNSPTGSNTLAKRLYSKKPDKCYFKTIGMCGKVRSHGPESYNRSTWMLHTKLWISEKSVLISTYHPNNTHMIEDLANYDLYVKNAPGFTRIFGNHFSYVYNYCGIFTEIFPPKGPWKNKLLPCETTELMIVPLTNPSNYTPLPPPPSPSPPSPSPPPFPPPPPPSPPPSPPPHPSHPPSSILSIHSSIFVVILSASLLTAIVPLFLKSVPNLAKLSLGVAALALACTLVGILVSKGKKGKGKKGKETKSEKMKSEKMKSEKMKSEEMKVEKIFWTRPLPENMLGRTLRCPNNDCCIFEYSGSENPQWCGQNTWWCTTDEDSLLPEIGDLTMPVGSEGFEDQFAMVNIYSPTDWSNYKYPVNPLEVFRFKSVTSNPAVAWYVAKGTGTVLQLGKTLKAKDKVDACLQLIRSAAKKGFRGFTETPNLGRNAWVHRTVTNPSSDPVLFLMEILETTGKDSNTTGDYGAWQFSLSIPNQEILDFVQNVVEMPNNTLIPNPTFCSTQPGQSWKITSDAGYPSVHHLLIWYFKEKGVPVPPKNFWFQQNFTDTQKLCLENFFLNITEPDANLEPLKPIKMDTSAKYVLNRLANATCFDRILRSLCIQDKYSIPAFDKNGKQWLPEETDTIQMYIQPNGNSGWAFEINDYRFNANEASTWIGNQHVALPQWSRMWQNYFENCILPKDCSLNFDIDWSVGIVKCSSGDK